MNWAEKRPPRSSRERQNIRGKDIERLVHRTHCIVVFFSSLLETKTKLKGDGAADDIFLSLSGIEKSIFNEVCFESYGAIKICR